MARKPEMIGIDTNILLRFLVDDDPEQSAIARQFMGLRNSEDPAYVSAVVLAETVWFLTRRLDYPRSQIAEMLGLLVQAEGIVFEHSNELRLWSVETSHPTADIADYLIAWAAFKAGCSKTMTFDKQAATRVPGMELLA
jgi:predicted nucleic-acid-binding protein